jgi:predicted component of viral defense system (DUF524 family)
MPKKTKRNLSVQQVPVETALPVNTYSRPAASFSTVRTSYSQEFKPDYSLVISDLKTIGGLAAFFTVVLVVLSFFLR